MPRPLALLLSLLVSPAWAAGNDAWIYTSSFAVKAPPGWKVLSNSDIDGVGQELLVGRSREDYARIFVSGDKITVAEFRTRMQQVIADATKNKKLLREPALEVFQKSGLILKLIFKSEIHGREFFEAHEPLALGTQGADVEYVAPLTRYPEALKELELLLANLRVYWGNPPKHKATH